MRWKFRKVLVSPETRRMDLECSLRSLMASFYVLTLYQSVTVRWTDIRWRLRPRFAMRRAEKNTI